MKKINSTLLSTLAAVAAVVVIGTADRASAAQTAVSAIGVNGTATSANWLTDGLGTLNGRIAGVNWSFGSGAEGNSSSGNPNDWYYINAGFYNSGNLAVTTEWPTVGSSTNLGYVAFSNLGIAYSMSSDVSASVGGLGSVLVISEVATGAGDFSLNGVAITASAAGQVLQWSAPVSAVNWQDELDFTSTFGTTGAVAFSAAAVPEPSTWAMMLGGLGMLTMFRRRRA